MAHRTSRRNDVVSHLASIETAHITTGSAAATESHGLATAHQQFRRVVYDRIIELRRRQFPKKPERTAMDVVVYIMASIRTPWDCGPLMSLSVKAYRPDCFSRV